MCQKRLIINFSDFSCIRVYPPIPAGELDIIRGYILAVNPPVGVSVDAEALAKRLAELDASDDAATIKAAVKEAISQTTFTVTSK